MDLNTRPLQRLQVQIFTNQADLDAFINLVSRARLNRYLKQHCGDKHAAVALYHANAKISQCLYLPIQIWEVALRNRLDAFLRWKFGQRWPWDPRLRRALSRNETRSLNETLERQERNRGRGRVITDQMVADLSAGFWVGLLTKSYDVSFVWRHNLARVFPAAKPLLAREAAHAACDALLDLRNRIAHHEPIYHLPLHDRHAELTMLIAALCDRQSAYLSFASTFASDWEDVKRCVAP